MLLMPLYQSYNFECDWIGEACPINHNINPAVAYCKSKTGEAGKNLTCYNQDSDEWVTKIPAKYDFTCQQEGQICPIDHNA